MSCIFWRRVTSSEQSYLVKSQCPIDFKENSIDFLQIYSILVAWFIVKLSIMSDQSSSSASLKSFLTEEQIEIERQRRQADWERVRSSNDPIGISYFLSSWCIFTRILYVIEAPAEVFDNRSLYEKLKVQHDAKKKEFEDTWAASKWKTKIFF